jgi:hypothetical protein
MSYNPAFLPPSYQVIWSDNTGEHTFLSTHPQGFGAAMTIAIALQASNSCHWVQVWEKGDEISRLGGTYYYSRLKYSTNKGSPV